MGREARVVKMRGGVMQDAASRARTAAESRPERPLQRLLKKLTIIAVPKKKGVK